MKGICPYLVTSDYQQISFKNKSIGYIDLCLGNKNNFKHSESSHKESKYDSMEPSNWPH